MSILISSRHLFVHFVLPFLIKGLPRSPLLFICRPFGFFILCSVDKSIGSGCFFPDLDPSVNLIGHAAIMEMIKLQFTAITERIRNKIRNGNWFPKFSIKRSAYEKERRPGQSFNQKWKDKMNKQMTT
jgi:hypothetical protein